MDKMVEILIKRFRMVRLVWKYYATNWEYKPIYKMILILVASVVCGILAVDIKGVDIQERFGEEILTVLGILLGFSVSVVALLVGLEGEGVKKAKAEICKDRDGKQVEIAGIGMTLYDELLSPIVMSVVVSSAGVTLSAISMIIIEEGTKLMMVSFVAQIFFLIYSIYLSVHSVLMIYTILSAKSINQ